MPRRGPVDRLQVHRRGSGTSTAAARCGAPGSAAPSRRPPPAAAAARRDVGGGAGSRSRRTPGLRSQTPGTGDPDVGVAPLGRVRRADVVAADEADLVVDHQDLAVVAAVAAQVEDPPAGVVDGVVQHPQPRPEPLEPGVHDEVGEAVVDRVDLHAAPGGLRERPLEPLADLVALPDVGLEEDPALGARDRGQHVVVEVLAEGVGGHGAVADRDRAWRGGREGLRLLAAPAVGVDEGEPEHQQHLEPEQGEQRPRQRATDGGEHGAAAGHVLTLAKAAVRPPVRDRPVSVAPAATEDCRWAVVRWSA